MTSFDPTIAGLADETDWLAVRYVLGELPADAAAAFEDRLAEDQPAREAVARAARLVETLASVPQPADASVAIRRTSPRRIAAIAATVAAAVVFGVFLRRNADDAGPRNPQFATKEVDPARLVVLWSLASEATAGDTDAEAFEDADPDAALLPPDWLLAAVEQEAMSADASSSLDPESDEIETN